MVNKCKHTCITLYTMVKFEIGKDYSTSKTNIKIGEWNSNYNEVKKKADSDRIPMIVYWTPGSGCGWCTTCEKECLLTNSFKNWRAKTPYLWCYQ